MKGTRSTVSTCVAGFAIALCIAAGFAPGAASAASTPAPGAYSAQNAYQIRLGPFMRAGEPGGAEGAAREALGSQFVELWLNDDEQGWDVGLGPGALDADQARAAIIAQLRTRYSADDVAHLADLLHVHPQPHGLAELQATEAAIRSALDASGILSEAGIGPWVAGTADDPLVLSTTVHVLVDLYSDWLTPDVRDRVDAIVAPYGDEVSVTVYPGHPSPSSGDVGSTPPAPTAAQPTASTPLPTPAHKSKHTPRRGARGSVTVPDAERAGQAGLEAAYEAVRAAHLFVRIPTAVFAGSLCGMGVSKQSPAAGTRVKRGSVVTLTPVGCFAASPAVPVGPLPTAVVPNMTGWTVGGAIRWAEGAHQGWEVPGLPPLKRGTAMTLFDNYRLTRQEPAAGATLTLGVDLGNGGFRPTALTIHGVLR